MRANYLRPVAEVSLEVRVTATVVVNCVHLDDRAVVNAHVTRTLAVRATFDELVIDGQRSLLQSLAFAASSVRVITFASADEFPV